MIRVMTLMLAATLALAACGKKGDLEPPKQASSFRHAGLDPASSSTAEMTGSRIGSGVTNG